MSEFRDLSLGDGHASAPPTPGASPRKPLIPPHIAWPGFVVLLLLTGVGSAFQALYAAHSDGGVEIVESYARAQAGPTVLPAAGWNAAVEIGDCTGGLCAVRLTVLGADDAPVRGLTGTLAATRGTTTHTLPLKASAEPGVYVQAMPVGAPGPWRFALDARQGRTQFDATVETR